MNDLGKIRQIIEGLLLTAGKPLTLDKIGFLFTKEELPEREVLKAAIEEIEKSCEGRGFELKKVASGYRFQVRQELSDWIGRLWEEKPQRYSRALLETIAIIAYRQPITRGDIEKIRGVAVSSSTVRTLLERNWVRVVGHRDVPGRPAMYASTREFLDYFNLENLNELPELTEIRDMEGLNQELTLDEESPEGNVIEFPSALEDEEGVVADDEELAAAAIGTRSIDEILGIKQEAEEDEDESEEEQDELDSETDAIVTDNSEADGEIDSSDQKAQEDNNEDEESLG
ncbi:MAG: SMC-Scp complex subunit ScpB [Gammaproteobacteria bacterium]|jgi:segregation and condensation protein B|nr:SMC-Scp complex subunit ScpB [Gammaproteobacteria bacterium]